MPQTVQIIYVCESEWVWNKKGQQDINCDLALADIGDDRGRSLWHQRSTSCVVTNHHTKQIVFVRLCVCVYSSFFFLFRNTCRTQTIPQPTMVTETMRPIQIDEQCRLSLNLVFNEHEHELFSSNSTYLVNIKGTNLPSPFHHWWWCLHYHSWFVVIQYLNRRHNR